MANDRVGKSSGYIRQHVQTTRNIQQLRFANHQSTEIVCYADMRVGEIRQYCKEQEDGQRLPRAAMTQLNLSARAYHRILILARTIADLTGSVNIQLLHLVEALQYRPRILMSGQFI